MKRATMNAAAARSSNDDRYAGAPTIPAFRRKVRNLIEGAGNEIGELHFRDRPHSHQCRADRGSDDSGFGYRCVDDAPLAELFEHSGSNLKCTTVGADVLTQDKHTFVLLHFFPDA